MTTTSPKNKLYRLVRQTVYKSKSTEEYFSVIVYDLDDYTISSKSIHYSSYKEMVQHFADYPNEINIEMWVARLKTAYENKGDTSKLNANCAELQNTFIESENSKYTSTYAVHFDSDLNPISLIDAESLLNQYWSKNSRNVFN